MKKILTGLLGLFAMVLVTACDGGSKTGALSVSKEVTLDVPAADAWNVVGNFSALHGWHPAVTATTMEGNTIRVLTLGDGATIREELVKHDDASMSCTYKILEGPLPIANYVSTLKVSDAGGKAKVTWSSTFDAAGVADDEAKNVIAGIYDAGLANLPKSFK